MSSGVPELSKLRRSRSRAAVARWTAGAVAATLSLFCASTVRAQCGWDPGNDTIATATPVSGCFQGSYCLDSPGDLDFYKIDPTFPAMLTFETLGSTDTYMYLLNYGGQVLRGNDDGGEDHNASITFEVSGGATYYVEVAGYASTTTGVYDLKISGCCGSDPYDNDFGHATPYSGGYLSESINCGGDLDMYRFTADAAGTYTFNFATSAGIVWAFYDSTHVLQDAYSNQPTRAADLAAGEELFIAVKGFQSDDTGDYTLQNTGFSGGGCGSDPGDDDTTHATSLGSSCGTTSAGIDCGDDVDFYAFSAPTNGTYTFDVSAMSSHNITLYSSGGSLLEGPSGSAVSHTLSAGDQVFVRVMAGIPGQTFSYDVTVSGCSAGGCGSDPGNDDFGAATDLAGSCGTTLAGVDCNDDHDYYRFTAPVDGSLTFETTGSTDTYMTLFDHEHHEILSNDDGGTDRNALIDFAVSQGSTYYLMVRGYSSTTTGDYSLVISGCSAGGCGPDPGDDDTAHATSLGSSCGTTSAGIDCGDDVDFYAFSAPTNGTYTFDVSAMSSYNITLYSSGGSLLEGPSGSAVSHTLSAGEQVFVRVMAGIPGQTFSYSLTVAGCDTSGCGAEVPNDDPAHATVLAGCGASQSSFDCAGDVDYFALTPPANGVYSFETAGDLDTRLWIEDDASSVLAFDDDGGSGYNSHVDVQLESGRTYYAHLEEYSGRTGPYSLDVDGCAGGCAGDPGNDSLASATQLPGPGTYPASFECPGDVDYYGLKAAGGGRYSFGTTGDTDTLIQVLDASGGVLAEDDDSGPGHNARATVELTDGDRYAVRVNEHGDDETGDYDLEINIEPEEVLAYQYLVPAAAKAAGVAGTNWSSDLVLLNVGERAAAVNIYALLRDQANPNPTSVSRRLDAGEMLRSEDVLADLFGMTSGAAALLVASTQPLVVASRTFNSAANGTFGQFIPGMPAGQLTPTGSKVYLQGLVENGSYRSNLGLVNAEGFGPIDVTVRFRRPDGSALGAAKTYHLEPMEYIQRTQVLREVTSADVDLAWVELSATGRFAAYLSVVDFGSGDPIYRVASPVSSGTGKVVLMGLAKVPGAAGTNWVSDGSFLNPGGVTTAIRLDLVERDNPSAEIQSTSFFLEPGNCYSSADVLRSMFGRQNGAASLVVRPDQAVMVDARTYNLIASGTFGQNIPAMDADDVLDSSNVGMLVMTRQDDAFRTNVGLMNNLQTTPSDVDLVLRDSSGGSIGTSWRVTLIPGEVTQLNAALNHFAPGVVSGAYLEIRVVSGAVLAYGSMVDQSTGDPVYEVPSVHERMPR